MPNARIDQCSCGRAVLYRNAELLCPTCNHHAIACACSQSVGWARAREGSFESQPAPPAFADAQMVTAGRQPETQA